MNEYQEKLDVIVIGAGKSGLALGYYLKNVNKKFLILDESPEIGFSWSQRYDSLKLFTNARHDSLDGLKFSGNQNRFPSKNEMSEYLKKYAGTFSLPIKLNTKVVNVQKNNSELFTITTFLGIIYHASNVVIATGLAHTPFIPEIARKIDKNILQIHSSDYKNVNQLNGNSVLVVGGGNSGVQISEDLAQKNKTVYFSFRAKLKSFNNYPIKWQLFSWFVPFLIRYKTFIIKLVVKFRDRLIIGTDLEKLFKRKNIFLVGKIIEIKNNEIICAERKIQNIENIIWATGFKFDLGWIDFSIFDNEGYPIHKRGVTSINGLYFLGFSWLQWKKQSFIIGTSAEANYIFNKIVEK